MVGRERYRIQEGFEDSPLSPCSRRADGRILATSSSFAGRSQLSEGSMTPTIAGAALTARPPMMDSQRPLEDEISQRLVRKRPRVFWRAIFEKSPRPENQKSSPLSGVRFCWTCRAERRRDLAVSIWRQAQALRSGVTGRY